MNDFERSALPPNTIAAKESDRYYMIVILRDDQMDIIRAIVREEIRAALAQPPNP
jgi:hypothetical protein